MSARIRLARRPESNVQAWADIVHCTSRGSVRFEPAKVWQFNWPILLEDVGNTVARAGEASVAVLPVDHLLLYGDDRTDPVRSGSG